MARLRFSRFMRIALLFGLAFVIFASQVGAALVEPPSDFNGDLTSDILWRNLANGSVVIWSINGGAISNSQAVYSAPSANWEIIGLGDFNGDGKSDILWQDSITGTVAVWFMNGANITGSQLVYTMTDPNWKVAGIGDFNGDGKADIAWRNAATGDVVVWLMNGASLASAQWVNSPDSTWQVAGIGDLDGDGKSDIVWRNTTSGAVVVWFMNGTSLAGSQLIDSVSDPNWQVAGIGDLNGDRKADILWRNTANGAVVAWLMNGGTITSSQWVYSVPGANLQIVKLGDFNGDGKTDILWRDSNDGALVVWLMNGASIANSQLVYTVADPNWQIQQHQYQLVWSDEFNGANGSAPDATKWALQTGGNGWGNNELEYYTARPQNVQVQGGNLVITAAQENYTGPDGVARNYTSARMQTLGLFSQAYGRFEASIKIPKGQGLWPAFWMLGSDINTNPWPACGEIDIMENIGKEPAMNHGSLHGPGYSPGNVTATYTLPSGALGDGFHLYAMEWDAQQVRFYVDSNLYATFTAANLPPGATWEFNKPFFILLNVAVGGSWPGSPDATTQFPQQMLVDYVRVYQ